MFLYLLSLWLLILRLVQLNVNDLLTLSSMRTIAFTSKRLATNGEDLDKIKVYKSFITSFQFMFKFIVNLTYYQSIFGCLTRSITRSPSGENSKKVSL